MATRRAGGPAVLGAALALATTVDGYAQATPTRPFVELAWGSLNQGDPFHPNMSFRAAAGVNVGLRTAGGGAERLTEAAARSSAGASATLYGVRVAAGSLWRSFARLEPPSGGQPDG